MLLDLQINSVPFLYNFKAKIGTELICRPNKIYIYEYFVKNFSTSGLLMNVNLMASYGDRKTFIYTYAPVYYSSQCTDIFPRIFCFNYLNQCCQPLLIFQKNTTLQSKK